MNSIFQYINTLITFTDSIGDDQVLNSVASTSTSTTTPSESGSNRPISKRSDRVLELERMKVSLFQQKLDKDDRNENTI